MHRNKVKWIITTVLLAHVMAYSCKTHYKLASQPYTAKESPSSFENGKNLLASSCGGCHYNPAVNKYIGNQLHDLPRLFGKLYSANLTESEMYGVTLRYTDQQLAYLIKTGIKKDGRFIPYMLRPNIADADLNDIIVYLRSTDAAVAAADTSVGKTHLNLLGKTAIHMRKPEPYVPNISKPTESITDGRYLVDIIGCFHCHSKGLTSLNYLHPEESKHYMMGGMMFKTPDGKKVYGSNLTPCKTTGIGYYSQEDFRKAVKEGIAPGGRKLSPPMDKYDHLADKQLDDIFAYLLTLPKAHHLVKGHVETMEK